MKLSTLTSNSIVLLGTICIQSCFCMPNSHIQNLRREAHDMFHHGYDAYYNYAFPADEIRPLSCVPLSRDNEPTNFVLNDVLGNYSLTAVDSLSALAILSHTSTHSYKQFWRTVKDLVTLYYPIGFNKDSKVQVFETVIRGVGGLVSAHEFATGLLPMAGEPGVGDNGWMYNNELLHLAHDLATRLLPAFTTNTGIPFPRVNLKYGCVNVRPPPTDHANGEESGEKCRKDEEEAEKDGFKPLFNERTETCAAGAGSLTLEFSTLTRLLQIFKEEHPDEVEKIKKLKSGLRHRWDDVEVFERVSQASFWAVWERRSGLDLVGAGLDAVTGKWELQSGYLAGIGASTDSFFEYAMKTYILLSSSPTVPSMTNPEPSPAHAYLDTFELATTAIHKHMLVESPAVFYQGVHMITGDAMVQWVDSLSAFWPGLLVLAGDVSTAEKTCLFYTALWQRHQALPERYVPARQAVALQWWPGRPEFAESVYHLYRATKDVWYLHVGEMILRDIQRRCWGRCGWGGLQDVRSGEVADRMESFMLSETAAYLYLLFDDKHPLHNTDNPWVFTTEGHPIIMPKKKHRGQKYRNPRFSSESEFGPVKAYSCQNPQKWSQKPTVGALFSRTASRTDIFHSYTAVGLNFLPEIVPRAPTKISILDNQNTLQEFGYFNDKDEENPYRYAIPYSPTNGSFYPWTLPPEIISPSSYCAKLPGENKLDLVFSVTAVKPGEIPPPGWIDVRGGILINSLSGLRIGFAKEVVDGKIEYFVTKVGERIIRNDEIVIIDKANLDSLHVDGGVRFQTSKDEGYELVFDFEAERKKWPASTTASTKDKIREKKVEIKLDGEALDDDILKRVEDMLRDSIEHELILKGETERQKTAPPIPQRTLTPQRTSPNGGYLVRRHLHAILSSGIGAVEIPPLAGKTHQFLRSMEYTPSPTLPWRSIYVAGLACDGPLPSIAATYPVILLKRGRCPFSQKMNNIPTSNAIKLAIVVNFDDSVLTHKLYGEVVDLDKGGGVNDWVGLRDDFLIRPLLDKYQVDSRNGQRRKNPVALVFVGGGDATYSALAEAKAVGLRQRWKVTLDEVIVGNFVPVT
ncbi:alpha mannosidase-like protein [Orbilia ellipsospora]|uniref:alpha-1,2-Mannosidase n=1 Tax=Orbilia ellipsospora TaxID=2528407 RepID=A0AAV9XPS1_9PEZI